MVVVGGLVWLAGCNRPVADAQTANPGHQAAPASGRVNPGPVNGGPIDNGPLPASPGATAGPGNATPPGEQVDNSLTNNRTATPPDNNPAPAPGSNANGAGGATSSYGRGGSGSSLSPTVSGRSPYEGTADHK